MNGSDSRPGRRPVGRLLAAVGVLLLFAAGAAEASLLRAFTLPELRSGSDVIVTGRVLGVRSVRVDGTIETVARVRVTENWSGETRRTIRVRVPGGQAAGRRLVVPGAPTFEPGDEMVLFLYADGPQYRPVGMFQGVWLLDAERPELARVAPATGASLVRTDDAPGPIAVERPERTVAQLVGGGAR